ncbi:retrovirus-related pol polyprotein from transposon TNT 1-94 [Tanacetum coccineum]
MWRPPRRNDVYVVDMSSLTPNRACFFATSSESVNWLWHKRLSHLNFKNINKLAKQNKVLGLPSLVYSTDKPCSACEKGKHIRASFKTNKTSQSGNSYIISIWTYLDQKKSQAAKMIMSFIRMVENQNDVKVKQIRTDNRTEFRNSKLESFFDEKGISQNFASSIHLNKMVRQQVEETYHVTFDESMEAIRFTNTSTDEIGINNSSRYPPDEFAQEDDPCRQYQANSKFSYYIIPHGRSLTELTQEKHVPEVIAPNEQDNPQTEDVEGNNTETSVPITNPLVPEVSQSQDTNHASTSSYPVAQDRWSRDQHIEHVNIISNLGEGMLTRSMAVKLTATLANECLFANFLSEIEPKTVFEALKHSGWVFKNKKDEHGIITKNKERLVAQGYSQKEGIEYDETFAPVARMEAIRIFLALATDMNFIVFKMDVKSGFLNGKLKEEIYVKQPPGFESSEFPNYVCKLDKTLYGLKQAPRARSSVKTPMVPPNNLGPELAGNQLMRPLLLELVPACLIDL